MTTATQLTGVVAEHIHAVNDFDTDAIVATFADDAYVNDARREIRGINAMGRWVNKEMVGNSVTIEPLRCSTAMVTRRPRRSTVRTTRRTCPTSSS